MSLTQRLGGSPLPPKLRRALEAMLATDLAAVRLHTDAAAAADADALSAEAFTVGDHIAFAAGRFDPESAAGRRLIAHEVAHTVQQRGASPAGELAVSAPGDAHEREADRVAEAFVDDPFGLHLTPVRAGAAPAMVQRQASPPARKPSDAARKKYTGEQAYAEVVMRRAESVFEKLLEHHDQEMKAISAISAAAGHLVKTYDDAYTRHEAVIKKANEAEEGRQKLLDLVLGVVVGVATGVTGNAVAKVLLKAKQLGFSLWRSLAEEVVAQPATLGASTFADIRNTVSAVAKENKDAARWKMVAELYREAADLVPALGRVFRLALAATKVAGACNAAAAGNALPYSLDIAALDEAIGKLRRLGAEAALAGVETEIAGGWKELIRMQVHVESKADDTRVLDMERYIWMQWIAHLRPRGWGDDYTVDQLDNDTIERHLESLGLTGRKGSLGHDAGRSTDADDERIIHDSAVGKLRVLEMVGAVGKVKHVPRLGLMISNDNRSVECELPHDDHRTGFYEVMGAIGKEGAARRTGEKRVRWVASLRSLPRWEVEDRGLK